MENYGHKDGDSLLDKTAFYLLWLNNSPAIRYQYCAICLFHHTQQLKPTAQKHPVDRQLTRAAPVMSWGPSQLGDERGANKRLCSHSVKRSVLIGDAACDYKAVDCV